MLRRVIDVVASALGLILLAPILLAIGAAVALTSKGGALFSQERVGLDGRPFRLYKFRTMRLGATGPQITASDDTRITTIGGLLRRLKLDELPQLLNVLRGDMSLVGPRPEVPSYVEHYLPQERKIILSVRPGITDPLSLELIDESKLLAQVSDPEAHYLTVLLPYKTKRQASYVASRTLRGDLAVIAKTIWRIVGGRRLRRNTATD